MIKVVLECLEGGSEKGKAKTREELRKEVVRKMKTYVENFYKRQGSLTFFFFFFNE